MLIICLCGKKQHGKSTLAEHLKQRWNFQEFSFAMPLKLAVKEIFHLTDAQVFDHVGKETVDSFWKVTPRHLLQIVGTELFRDTLPTLIPETKDVWVRSLVKQIQSLPEDSRVVISDCRFCEEWNAMRALGAKMVRIIRPNYVSDSKTSNHSSETSLDDTNIYIPDILLFNNGTLDDMYDKIMPYIQSWFLSDLS